MNRKTGEQLNREQTRVPTSTFPLVFAWCFLINALIVKSLALSPTWRGCVGGGEQLRNKPYSKLQKYEDRTCLSFTRCQVEFSPPPMPSGAGRPVPACAARLWPPAPKIQLPPGSQGRAAECLFVWFLFYCEFHRVDRRRVCTTVCNKYWKKKSVERSGISASWWLKCFPLMSQKQLYKHFHSRSLWIFPHKDFITLTRPSWAKIINNKTNRVRGWHQLFVSDQYATSNPNTTRPKANTRASRIFNAVRNMCCAEHVDACLPVLVMEKNSIQLPGGYRVLKNRNEDGVVKRQVSR